MTPVVIVTVITSDCPRGPTTHYTRTLCFSLKIQVRHIEGTVMVTQGMSMGADDTSQIPQGLSDSRLCVVT